MGSIPPFSSEIPKPVGSTEKLANDINRSFAMPVPAFGDLGKAANDLINKDFYHTAQGTLDVKLKAPNGMNVAVKGKQGFDGVTSGSIEGKHTLKPQGAQYQSPSDFSTQAPSSSSPSSLAPTSSTTPRGRNGFIKSISFMTALPSPLRTYLYLSAIGVPNGFGTQEKLALTLRLPATGVTITQAWTTASLLDTKVELSDVVAPGAKVDLQNLWNPSKPNSAAQKLNIAWKNPNVHTRAFINYGTASGNVDATVDAVAGHEGFLVGGEAAYDVGKGAVTRYGLGLAYQTPAYNATVNAVQNLNVIMASYYQKVNSSV
ncbi:hypothetical protein KC354_g11155, partial [Hortaea werneckii]